MATDKQWSTIWDILRKSYPEAKLTDGQIEVYMRFLGDLSPEAVLAAVAQHTSTCKWFPKVSELRELAFRATDTTPFPTAIDAWGEVCKAISVVGCYGDPTQPYGTWWHGWTHPLIERVVNAMGWQSLCASTNEMADRAHFVKFYETMAERWKSDNQTLPEVKALRARLAAQQLPPAKVTPALPPPAEAVHSVATALATLASRMATAEQPEQETETERVARIEARKQDAMRYLAERA